MLQQIELYEDKFLPPSHPACERVVNVANQLIRSNKEIPQLQHTKWVVKVVNEPSVTNAFVLPVSHLNFPALCAKILLSYAYAHISSAGLLKHVGIPGIYMTFIQTK